MLQTIAAGASGDGGASIWTNIVGVVVGGAIVLVGQLLGTRATTKSAKEQRKAARQDAQREFQLEAVTRCGNAAAELRAALAATIDSEVPSREQSDRVSHAKSAFDVAVPRVHEAEIRDELRDWAVMAITWANGELGAADETTTWVNAMERLGAAERALA